MSINICIISPASHLEKYSSLGDCEMALTHLIIPDAGFHHSNYVIKNYTNYFKNKSQQGKWVILDNSAYEIGKLEATQASGEGLGPELVLKAAETINPSIVIAQDVLCNREATLESTKSFIKYVKDKGLLGKFQLMGVAQGKTKDEWLQSYEDLLKIKEIDQIGFSKISVPLSFGGNQAEDGCVAKARLAATATVSEEFDKLQLTRFLKPAHLLGGDNWLPWELKQQKQYSWIFSNDSSACIQYGIHNKTFDPHTGQIDKIITEKPDLENNFIQTVDLLTQKSDYILHNISILHKNTK